MTITTTKSWKNYITLCNVLDRNDIEYERDDKDMCVKCTVSGEETELNFLFAIDPSKMLITVFSPISVKLPKEKIADMALAVCMINHNLADGSFCIDIKDGFLYYKITSSFYESNLNETVFEYMLSAAANTVDEYYPKLSRIAASQEPYQETDPSDNQLALYLMNKMK